MSYAVMPLIDYKAACDKVREKVDLTTVKFEETNFGYLRSEIFSVPKDGKYIFSCEFSNPIDLANLFYGSPDWKGETAPGYFESIDSNNAKTMGNLYAGEQYRLFIADSTGLTTKDILKASLSIDGETVVDFVPPPTIKSGELADKVDEVYWTAASDFGLKGKGQGELVTLENVHPIEHKVEVGLSSKNLFNDAEANITKTEDYFKSNVGYSTDAFYSLAVEPNETYIATFMIRTEVEHVWGSELGVGIGSLPTYGQGRIALSLIQNESYQNFATHTITFTVPADVHIVYFQTDTEYKFKNFQIEKGNSATAYAPYVADFSDCKVTACGKNLFNEDKANITKTDDYFTSAIHYTQGAFYELSVEPNEKYTISYLCSTPDVCAWGTQLLLGVCTTPAYSGGTAFARTLIQERHYNNFSADTLTFKVPADVYKIYIQCNLVFQFKNFQIEKSTTATEYEPYIGAEYTAAADGTVENVKSISPTMNLSTNKAGAVINAECFLDPQAVITDLTNTVITLGGEI